MCLPLVVCLVPSVVVAVAGVTVMLLLRSSLQVAIPAEIAVSVVASSSSAECRRNTNPGGYVCCL